MLLNILFSLGDHAWAVYAVVALALAYFQFRKKEKSLISVTLKPIFGHKTDGFWGKILDSITVFATAIGVATTLGFGAGFLYNKEQIQKNTKWCYYFSRLWYTYFKAYGKSRM